MDHTFEADLGFLPKILVSSSTTTEETFPCGPWLWAFVLRKTLTCSLYALTIEVIQLFQLRLSPEQSGKVEYVTKFIHLLAIPSSLSRSYSPFPLCSGITLRLQDTLFGVLRKIATARSISVRLSSNFHQMFSSACKIW